MTGPAGSPGAYAATHSLGAPSAAVVDAIAGAVDVWRDRLVGGWEDWVDVAGRVGDRLGAAALGAAAGQVVIADSTTVNLYKLAVAALDARPDLGAIVIGADEFPTDRYVLEGLAASRGLDICRDIDVDPALVCRSAVDFRTSTLADMREVTDAAHNAGALMLWDLSHAVGIVPMALDELGADLAVGCTYKWLAAGPGAPAFLYVRGDLQAELRQPIWGWFGQRDMFAMGPQYDPEPDIRRFQAGTPPIIAIAGVDAAVGVVEAAGIEAVRSASLALTSRFIDAVQDRFDVVTPVEPAHRGGHVALRVGDAAALHDALAAAGVVTDVRGDLIRFGFAPLTTDPSVVDAAAEVLNRLGPN